MDVLWHSVKSTVDSLIDKETSGFAVDHAPEISIATFARSAQMTSLGHELNFTQSL